VSSNTDQLVQATPALAWHLVRWAAITIDRRIEDLEAASRASATLNVALQEEVSKCLRQADAARRENEALKDRVRWLSSQLVVARKQLGPLVAGHSDGKFDEARAVVAALEKLEADGGAAAAAAGSSDQLQAAQQHQGGKLAASAGQQELLHKLRARGISAGWLVDASEVWGAVHAQGNAWHARTQSQSLNG
jgi:hypothetical protein